MNLASLFKFILKDHSRILCKIASRNFYVFTVHHKLNQYFSCTSNVGLTNLNVKFIMAKNLFQRLTKSYCLELQISKSCMHIQILSIHKEYGARVSCHIRPSSKLWNPRQAKVSYTTNP